MSQAEALYQLQKIDVAILQHQKRLTAIDNELKDNKRVLQARKKIDKAQSIVTPLKANLRDLELQIQSNSTKAKTAEQRLYSGTVKNPKELQDLQNEIASLKRWHDELEDRMLEVMVTTEEAEADLQDTEDSFAEIQKQWEDEHQDLLEEQSSIQTDIEKLQKQRRTALIRVDANSLKLYDEMKGQKANQPVSLMKSRSCSVCGIEQTTLIEQEVRRGDKLVTCRNCGRILAYSI